MLPTTDSSLTLGRLLGVPVRVSPGAFLIAGLIAMQLAARFATETSEAVAWIVAGTTALGFLASILVHELGHAIAARRSGVAVSEIRLWFFGGAAALERQAPTPGSEILIAAAGPAASAGIGVAALGAALLAPVPTVVGSALVWLGVINLILAVFNMLPGLPLDGGRVLTGWLWRRRGDRLSAVRTTATVGRFVGRVGFGLALVQIVMLGSLAGIMTAFVAMILVRGAATELAHEELLASLADRTVGDVAAVRPATVNQDLNTAAARAMFPSPELFVPEARYGIVVDESDVARGLVDLMRLDAAAERDGSEPVMAHARPLGQNDVAYRSETLASVLRRGVNAPFVVIDEHWRAIGIVSPKAVLSASASGPHAGPQSQGFYSQAS